MPDFILEIGTEDLPSLSTLNAVREAKPRFQAQLKSYSLDATCVQILHTPRRITFFAELPEKQSDTTTKYTGPAHNVAFDEHGKPTKAAIGFARSKGVSPDKLEIVATDKGEYVAVTKLVIGQPVIKILPELIDKIFSSLHFDKNMRWGSNQTRFLRPIRHLCARFGTAVVPYEITGVTSTSVTFGHRIMAPGAIEFSDFADYCEKLRAAYVIVDPKERQQIITDQLQLAAASLQSTVILDQDLLSEVCGLVEYPQIMAASFPESYLELPESVLITSMKKNQKYFALRKLAGQMNNNFLFASNMPQDEQGFIRSGNERVLNARLSDARFFHDADLKKGYPLWLKKQETVLFQEQLGSIADKTARVGLLAESLARNFASQSLGPLKRAAQIYKADLSSEIVQEFPVLQGTMGQYYAEKFGETKEVALAIYEHYLPRYAGDELPESECGAILALAEKIDTITGCFGVGLIPSGSQDPYALRRQALGVLQIIIDKKYPLSCNLVVAMGLDCLGKKLQRPQEEVERELADFYQRRLDYLLEQADFPHDIRASLRPLRDDQYWQILAKAKVISEFRKKAEFSDFTICFKRVTNILKKAETTQPCPSLLICPEEKVLFESTIRARQMLNRALEEHAYQEALEILLGLKQDIDGLFDAVMIMDKDPVIAKNRLGLLNIVAEQFLRIADFSQLEAS